MSGIINATPDDAVSSDQGDQASSGGGLSNPLLQQAEQHLETNLTPENRANYLKIVVAGLHIALDKGADGFMGKLRNSRDPISDCARGAVALVLIMRRESKGLMPMKAAIPAGMTLMFHGLDFVDRAKIAKVAEPELDKATSIFTNTLFAKLNITPAMLQQITGKVHAIVMDPAKMELINRKAGLVKSPDASEPTFPAGPPGTINGGGAAGEAQ